MKIVKALLFTVLAFFLVIVSLPWIILSIGYGVSGDFEGFERVNDKMPLIRFLDWMEAK